jgi:cysteine-rich repeat protein
MRLSFFLKLSIILLMVTSVSGECSDGVLDVGEGCDDGNSFNFDGCNVSCVVEDVSESTWLCTTVPNELSVCCLVMINPVTLDKVCGCTDAVQPDVSMGFSIAPECTKRDINECNVNNGGCHEKANCINYDAATDPLTTYECICPPGWLGDGVTRCDINTYDTVLKLVEYNVASVDTGVVKTDLLTSGVIPGTVVSDDIIVSQDAYYMDQPLHVIPANNTGNRRLLATQTGVEITVTIMSDSVEVIRLPPPPPSTQHSPI